MNTYDYSDDEFYDDVTFEDNQLINPPRKIVKLSNEIFFNIESQLQFYKKDEQKFRDYLTFKLYNLLLAFKSGEMLVYSRDYNIYRKFYSCDQNRHFWEWKIITSISDALDNGFYVKQFIGKRKTKITRGFRTRVSILPSLAKKLKGIEVERIERSDNLNPIELRKRAEHGDHQIPVKYNDNDDPYIPKMRNELNQIYGYYKNQNLAGFVPNNILNQNLQFTKYLKDCDTTGRITSEPEKDGQYFTIEDRWVRRIFNEGTFLNGGRLYASWQNIPKELRKWLLINGSKVAEFDYSACQIRMLYHVMLNRDLNCESPYFLPGVPLNIAKKAAIISLNAVSRNSSAGALRRFCEKNLDTSLSFEKALKIIKLFEGKHNEISEYFNSGAGVVLMRIESEIIVRIILALLKKKICVLTIHDSCIFPIEHKQTVYETMMKEYRRVLNFYPVVK